MSRSMIMGLIAAMAGVGGLQAGREHLSLDKGWRFALGHPSDSGKDFRHGTSYFSYLAKAGYGDGPAASKFDDRAWRLLDLPHDWAVELPFDGRGSHSHGYQALGRNFPDASVGWYRRGFYIPASDQGRRLRLHFDGVHRDAMVWVNGFYLGRESSGSSGFGYDITELVDYGGSNVVAVRADATLEEGWYYEGAGIYRHVWLDKTAPLHVVRDGIFVRSVVEGGKARLQVTSSLQNETAARADLSVEHQVLDPQGKAVASGAVTGLSLAAQGLSEAEATLDVGGPLLWSLETPQLYTLITRVSSGGQEIDRVDTRFGIRTLRFDADHGFFLNGKPLKLKGTNNHQDHAGLGAALPDAMQDYRLRRLKEMGSNAYRSSHNPPTPELLDACDRLGMLVLVENRLMGTSPEVTSQLSRMVLRDRNHPSVIAWSIGNEEWAIEGNEKGTRIAAAMQAQVQRLDPTRRVSAGISGGWGQGISKVIDVMGYNYMSHGSTDDQHAQFPLQPGMGTEESTSQATRGIYVEDKAKAHMPPSDRREGGSSVEKGWQYYAQRPYLAGLFYWTGFDYRGESNPYGYPAVSSQFGILDTCGFPKDSFYYLKAWWGPEPVLHLAPHWNWPGREGQEIVVWATSNGDEVELALNGRSLGRKAMPVNSHLEWTVSYEPGTLSARAFRAGKELLSVERHTSGPPEKLELASDKPELLANAEDVAVLSVAVLDAKGWPVPTAGNKVSFRLEGPGKIIGVGNGDPSCHEPDQIEETVAVVKLVDLKMRELTADEDVTALLAEGHDAGWSALFQGRLDDNGVVTAVPGGRRVIRGSFELAEPDRYTEITLLPKSLVDGQAIYVNGRLIADKIQRDEAGKAYPLTRAQLRPGKNSYAVVGQGLVRRKTWEDLNTDPGCLRTVTAAGIWQRSVFSGLAQVIVQATDKPGKLVLHATAENLAPASIELRSSPAAIRPEAPAQAPKQ